MTLHDLFKENKIKIKSNCYATLIVSTDDAYGELTIISKDVAADNAKEFLKKLIDDAKITPV